MIIIVYLTQVMLIIYMEFMKQKQAITLVKQTTQQVAAGKETQPMAAAMLQMEAIADVQERFVIGMRQMGYVKIWIF